MTYCDLFGEVFKSDTVNITYPGFVGPNPNTRDASRKVTVMENLT